MIKTSALLLAVCAAAVLTSAPVRAQTPAAAAATPASCPALLKQTFNRLQDDAPQNLCQYAGKVV